MCHDGARAHSIASTLADQTAPWISRVRPILSEAGPATSRAAASPAVVREIVSVACVGVTANCVRNSGSSAWVS